MENSIYKLFKILNMKKNYTLFLVIFVMSFAKAQNNVGIGTNTPNASAKLDISDANKGVLINRVNLTGTGDVATIVSPATGLLVFNQTAAGSGATAVDANSFYYFDGTKWVKLKGSNTKDWTVLGNPDSDITAPAAPATYGTSTFGATENWIGTIGADDFAIGTSNIERARFLSGGNFVLGKATATNADYFINLNTTTANSTKKGGIDMQLNNTLSAQGLNINIGASSPNVNGILATHNSGSLTTSMYTIGGILNNANKVSGYAGYRQSSGKTFGLYGITGDVTTYVPVGTNANTWALFSKGRALVSGNDPDGTTIINTTSDLDVRNTTSGATNPATLSLRQTTALATSGNILANLDFGDNYVAGAQARIQVLRDVAAGSASDLPSAITFSTTPDATSTLTERMRISNSGNVSINSTSNSQKLRVIGSSTTSDVLLASAPIGITPSYGSLWGSNSSPVSNGTGYGGSVINYGTFGSCSPATGKLYTFAIAGEAGTSANANIARNGGVYGGYVSNSLIAAWGLLGYRSSGGTNYGGYGNASSSFVGGNTGFTTNTVIPSTIGFAGIGDMSGSWSRGQYFGTINKGEAMASYNLGNIITNGKNIEIVNTKDKRTAVYSNTSTDNQVYKAGISKLVNGKSFVAFPENFKSLIKDKTTPIITVTAIGKSNGIYIEEITSNGFIVAENNNGNSNINFNWIAIAERIDADENEVPKDILSTTFDENMDKFLFDENNKKENGQNLWYDGTKLRFDPMPFSLEPDRSGAAKAKTEKILPTTKVEN